MDISWSKRFLVALASLAILCGLSGCTYDLVVRAGYANPNGVYSAVEGPAAAASGSGDAGVPVSTPDGGHHLGSNANYAYAVGFGANNVAWSTAYATPKISVATPTSDVATVPMYVVAQSAYGSAVTNTTGNNLWLRGGAATPATSGANGSIIVDLGTPAGGTKTGVFQVNNGVSFLGAIRTRTDNTGIAAFYLGPGITPSGTNAAFSSDGSTYTTFNAPTSGTVYFQIGASTYASLTTSALTLTPPSLAWVNSATTPAVSQAALASTSGGSGAAGQGMSVTAQAGQAATGASNNGGAGGNLALTAGPGGTSGSATAGIGGVLALGSGQTVKVTNISASTYTVDTNSTTSDFLIFTDSTSNAITITLPVPTAGRYLMIKDKTGKSATHNVTVSHNSAETIDGASTVVFTKNYDSLALVSDGTNWSVVSEFSSSIVP